MSTRDVFELAKTLIRTRRTIMRSNNIVITFQSQTTNIRGETEKLNEINLVYESTETLTLIRLSNFKIKS